MQLLSSLALRVGVGCGGLDRERYSRALAINASTFAQNAYSSCFLLSTVPFVPVTFFSAARC